MSQTDYKAYLHLTGVKGNSRHAMHRDAFEILSIRGGGEPYSKAFILTKKLDTDVHALAALALTGTRPSSGRLSLYDGDGSARKLFVFDLVRPMVTTVRHETPPPGSPFAGLQLFEFTLTTARHTLLDGKGAVIADFEVVAPD